jgi:hypothetical protein
MAKVILGAGNDAIDGTPATSGTSIEVLGQDFAAGSAVNIKVFTGKRPLAGSAQVRTDGRFERSATARPKLKCHAKVTATVHGADGVAIDAETEVFCPDLPR